MLGSVKQRSSSQWFVYSLKVVIVAFLGVLLVSLFILSHNNERNDVDLLKYYLIFPLKNLTGPITQHNISNKGTFIKNYMVDAFLSFQQTKIDDIETKSRNKQNYPTLKALHNKNNIDSSISDRSSKSKALFGNPFHYKECRNAIIDKENIDIKSLLVRFIDYYYNFTKFDDDRINFASANEIVNINKNTNSNANINTNTNTNKNASNRNLINTKHYFENTNALLFNIRNIKGS